jgi:hypothetical protein
MILELLTIFVFYDWNTNHKFSDIFKILF